VTRVPVNGIELNVEVAGEGRPLLLLHGFTGDVSTWAFLAGLEGVRRFAVDIVGHGDSASPSDPERYSMDNAARDLEAVLDAYAVEKAAVLGYSMGGRLALHFALDAPHRVEALILESASPGIEEPRARDARVAADDALADRIEQDGIDAFVDYWQSIPLFASQSRLPVEIFEAQRNRRLGQSPAGMANSLRGMGAGRQVYLMPRLSEIEAPTLLIAGALDERYAGLARTMGPLIRNSRVEILPDAGHAAHLEQPAVFIAAVEQFLNERVTRDNRQRIGDQRCR
jgi:2-succinyl-6-hydroxy-2,4-cyclohexadiene-1-carboxylate synthase